MKHPIVTDTSPLKDNPNFRPVVFDFEVLPRETMLSLYDIWADRWETISTPEKCAQTLSAYLLDPRTVFVGFNSKNYDNLIAAGCLNGLNQYELRQMNQCLIYSEKCTLRGVEYLTSGEMRFGYPGVWDFARRAWDAGFDLPPAPKLSKEGYKIPYMSLKKWEKFNGLKVERCPIGFDYPNVLTDAQAETLAYYNRYDVAALTRMICTTLVGEWQTRCGFAEILGKKFSWHKTFTKLAADMFVIAPKDVVTDDEPWGRTIATLPPNLVVANSELLEYFDQSLQTLERMSYTTNVAGVAHTFQIGGAHSVNERSVFKGDIWDIDVGSMYPSIMCLFNLCSRTMDAEKYNAIRLERMKMPKTDWRRDVFKKALNSTYGGMLDKFSTLYDPAKARQVCILGQLFIIDLIEKLEPYVKLIQTNTDGIYVIPNNEADAVSAKSVVQAFQKRTGLVMEIDHFKAFYQRDVNNYIAIYADGREKVRGAAFRSINHARPSVIQAMNRADIMGYPFDPDEFSTEELSIVCTRDKNSRGFVIDGVETNAETIDVVPVYPLQSQQINTVLNDGTLVKARLCPDYARIASQTTRSEINFNFYRDQEERSD